MRDIEPKKILVVVVGPGMDIVTTVPVEWASSTHVSRRASDAHTLVDSCGRAAR